MKSDNVHLGDVTFDPTTRTITQKDGRQVQLRNKSKDVLVCLLGTPGRTVTKADILNSVWSDVNASDESLVQCISDIRRLIGKDARQIVETVPREGYRINAQAKPANPKRPMPIVSIIVATFILVTAWFFWPGSAALPVKPEITTNTETSTGPPGTDNTEAYLEVLRGRISANRYSLSESLSAEQHFRKAISLDPGYARAYAELGTLLAVRFENNWTVLEDADREKALFYAEKAVSLDPELWLAHYALGRIYSLHFNLNLAEAHLEKAMSLQPDNEDARAYFGIVKNFQGEAESAVAILEQAVRSHPSPPYWYYYALGSAFLNARRYEEAETALNRCLELAEKSPYCLRYLIAVQGLAGGPSDAEAAKRAYASTGFELTISAIMKLLTFHQPEDLAYLERAFRLAGVPE